MLKTLGICRYKVRIKRTDNPPLSRKFGDYGVTRKEKKMKKFIIFVGIMMLLVNILCAQSYSGGSGTSEDPYEIGTKTDLKYLSEHSTEWTKHFKQTADIAFVAADFESDGEFYNGGAGFIPIGNISNLFEGSYNGDNYTIDGLFINRSSTDRIGFFGRTDDYAFISNIGMTNVNITGKGLTGGLIGQAYYNVSNCYVTGSVTGTSSVGGLIGQTQSISVSDCYSTATFSGTSSSVGGLIGSLGMSSTVSTCYSTGNVTGSSATGGFVGYVSVECTISNCYSLGDVTRSSGTETSLGGFCGVVQGPMESGDWPTIEYCYSIGSVDCGGATDKGFVGYEDGFSGSPTYTANFFDNQVSNQSTGTGAMAKNTTQMTTQSTFTGDGWDFANTWSINAGYNDGYPYLQDNNTLPVTLSIFTVQYLNNIPTLYWETQSETDNIGWYIYRNTKNNFESVERITKELINGYGTTTEQHSYLYKDNDLVAHSGDIYWYWIQNIDFGGQINTYDPHKLVIPNIEPEHYEPEIPIEYGLHQNNPNPFNPKEGQIEFSFILHKTSQVELNIYNIKGTLIKTLYNGCSSSEELKWDGRDIVGQIPANGIYLYALIVNGKPYQTNKLILLR